MARIILSRNWRAATSSFRAARKYGVTGNVAPFSTSLRRNGYEDTIDNLKIGEHTRVIFQGFTGRQATANAKESLAYGTNIVGGVKPGVDSEHLGLPVLPSVRAAVAKLKPDASAIYVPGNGTVQAMEDAIEAEIPLIVAVAEHIPIHDLLRINQMLRTQSKTRLVGANCPGIINTWGKCRLGFQPLPFFKPGNIGIVAKSGTLSYEAVASTTRAGLGQTYGISMGGDVIAGTNFVEAFKVLEEDDKTEGIIMIGEVGGRAELDAANWVKEYNRRAANPKPVMAVIGGIQAKEGKIMGHAGAWAAPGEASSSKKIQCLKDSGVTVVDHPEKLGEGMKRLLAERGRGGKSASEPGAMQKRGYHTMRTRPRMQTRSALPQTQKRTLYIKQSQAYDILNEKGIKTSDTHGSDEKLLAVTIDRSSRMPAISCSASTDPATIFDTSKKFSFAYGTDEATSDELVSKVQQHMGLGGDKSKAALKALISDLVDIFMSREAFIIETRVVINPAGEVTVQGARFGFDDAAFKSSGRQAETHALRDIESEVPEEVEAEKSGMIYVKYEGEGSVATIVNGAGLAMNTVDALVARGGHPANFMDTGGKATSDTIKAGFQIVTSDPRVKVIFVNIFGGLTLGDMIANGILLAFKDVDIKVPVVTRIRGSNEKEGQALIRESGLKMDAYDSFEEAAARAIAIANGSITP